MIIPFEYIDKNLIIPISKDSYNPIKDIEHLKGISYYPNQKKIIGLLNTLSLSNLYKDVVEIIKKANSELSIK